MTVKNLGEVLFLTEILVKNLWQHELISIPQICQSFFTAEVSYYTVRSYIVFVVFYELYLLLDKSSDMPNKNCMSYKELKIFLIK